jgi:hypothetical protein
MALARIRSAGRSIDAVAGVTVLLGLLALGTILVLRAPGLGWDEAVYATKARSFVTEIPASAWNLFRPPGLAYLGVLAAPFGFTDVPIRMLSMALGVVGLGAFGALGVLVGGRVAGLVAVLGAATLPIVLTELPLFHNDLLSGGVLFALMALLWQQLEVRPAPDWRLLLAPVLAAAAFYLRFGALAAILSIGLMMVALWWRRLVRAWRIAGASLVIGVLLAIPHVWLAIRETGSPLGILTLSVDKVDTTGPIATAVAYLRAVPNGIAGPIGLVLLATGMLVGLETAATLARRRGRLGAASEQGAAGTAPEERAAGPASERQTIALLWLLLPAAMTALALVLVSHAEPRYLMFPVLSLELAGSIGITRAARWLLARWIRSRPAIGADRGAVVLLAAFVIVIAAVTVHNAATRPKGSQDQAAWVREAGAWIDARAGGQPCLVVSTVYPILGWYAACASDEFMIEPNRLLPDAPPPGQTYLVFTSYDGHRRTPAELTRYRAVAGAPIARTGTAAAGAEVTLLATP